MKFKLESLFCVAAVIVLSGCGDSKSPASAANETQPAATPPTAASPAATAPATAALPAVTPPAAAPVAATIAPATGTADPTSQFTEAAAKQSDKVLGSIGGDLADKAKSFGQSLVADEAIKSQLNGTLQSLTAGKDSAALGSVFQVVQSAAKLTPQQAGLAKEVGNLVSAYVVQRNFASLDGAQGDVASVVNSLRQGELAATVPPIQRIGQNANLTPTQKELISTLADKYAPGLKKAADSLQQGLQGIKNLPGLK